MNKLKILNYAGSKIKYVDTINQLVNQSDALTYIEPFFGSGAVFYNLEKEFDEYYLSDSNEYVMLAHNSIKKGEHRHFVNFYMEMRNAFGDLKSSKEAYYNFRNWYNEKYYNTKEDRVEAGFGMIMLINSCINSLTRFGPSGFNQSYGNRDFSKDISEAAWSAAKSKLSRAILMVGDYHKLINTSSPSSISFIDPPYFTRPAGYDAFNLSDFNQFLQTITALEGAVLYTDTNHEFIDWDSIVLRDIRNSSPNRKEESSGVKDVLYYRGINKKQ
jgi:DNA adenine methylase